MIALARNSSSTRVVSNIAALMIVAIVFSRLSSRLIAIAPAGRRSGTRASNAAVQTLDSEPRRVRDSPCDQGSIPPPDANFILHAPPHWVRVAVPVSGNVTAASTRSVPAADDESSSSLARQPLRAVSARSR